MKTTQHIPFEKLADLAEERAAADELQATAAHLSVCSDCASRLQRVENVMLLMKTDREPDAPRDLIAYAVNIFGPGREAAAPSLLRRLVAALTFDSSVDLSPAFGVRSGQAAARQLLYSAAGNDVDVRIRAEQDQWVVTGQVLGQECPGGEVKLVNLAGIEGRDAPVTAALNEACEFSFPAVATGSYKLLLRLADIEVEVPQLELRG